MNRGELAVPEKGLIAPPTVILHIDHELARHVQVVNVVSHSSEYLLYDAD